MLFLFYEGSMGVYDKLLDKTDCYCPRHGKVLILALWGDRQGFAIAGFGKPNPPTFRKRKVALHLRNPHLI